MITPQQAIERLISNNELFYDEMTDLMRQIMSGQVPPEQIAAIMTGLRIKVETVSEITAAAAVMRVSSPPKWRLIMLIIWSILSARVATVRKPSISQPQPCL